MHKRVASTTLFRQYISKKVLRVFRRYFLAFRSFIVFVLHCTSLVIISSNLPLWKLLSKISKRPSLYTLLLYCALDCCTGLDFIVLFLMSLFLAVCHCSVLHVTELCSALLYRALCYCMHIQCSLSPYSAVCHCTVLDITALFCTLLYFAPLLCALFCCSELCHYYTVLYIIAL